MTTITEIQSQIRACTLCPLHKTRRNAVPGSGIAPAKLAIIGEGPGYWEDSRGRPFIGPSGELLDRLLDSIGLDRSKIYICNVINCRTSQSNRDPKQEELDACRQWLWTQLDLVNAPVVLCMGRFASLSIVSDVSPEMIRGSALKQGDVVYYFSYHPAAALHKPELEEVLYEQFHQLSTLLPS